MKVFLIFNGVGEIISSRIIENILDKGTNKNKIYILKPEGYHLSLLKGFNIIKLKSNVIRKKQINKFDLKIKIRSFMHFIHKKNKLFTMFFLRIAYLPISLKKLISIHESLVESNFPLTISNLSIYTPNTRLHLFQYLVCMANKFDYNLIEEGKMSFKKESLISINYKNKKNDEKLIDLFIVIIFRFLVISKLFLDLITIVLVNKKLLYKYLKKYIKAPIFNLNFLELKNKKPLTVNKISQYAFLNNPSKSQIIYAKRSRIEIDTLKKLNKKYNLNKNYKLIVLSGDSIPILKQEFDYSILESIDIDKVLIRPHPALFRKSIKSIDKILSLNLSNENLKLSDEIWKYPIELIANIDSFNIIYSKTNKSSVSLYIKNELI